MSTAPPLSFDDAAKVLRHIGGLKIVLVGGQAVNYWANRYAPGVRALHAGMPLTSKDIDFHGLRREVEECAKRIGGKAILASFDDHTPNSGVVMFTDSLGHARKIDFLTSVAGVKDKEVMSTAVPFTVPGAKGEVRVMHPVLCLESRAHNVARLPGYDTRQGRKQLRAAIFCARAFIAETLAEDSPRSALKLSERIFKFCLTPVAISLALDKRIDVFRAVRPHRDLPLKFRRCRYLQMRVEIERARSRAARRRR